jgi:hypothetical protein
MPRLSFIRPCHAGVEGRVTFYQSFMDACAPLIQSLMVREEVKMHPVAVTLCTLPAQTQGLSLRISIVYRSFPTMLYL